MEQYKVYVEPDTMILYHAVKALVASPMTSLENGELEAAILASAKRLAERIPTLEQYFPSCEWVRQDEATGTGTITTYDGRTGKIEITSTKPWRIH